MLITTYVTQHYLSNIYTNEGTYLYIMHIYLYVTVGSIFALTRNFPHLKKRGETEKYDGTFIVNIMPCEELLKYIRGILKRINFINIFFANKYGKPA